MVKFYVTQIRLGKMTLEQVPEKWKAKVEESLND